MRRILAILVLVIASLLGPAATGQAELAPDPLGGGAVLFNPLGGSQTQCTAAFAAVDERGIGYLVTGVACGSLLADQV